MSVPYLALDYDAVLGWLAAALALDPRNVVAHNNLAEILGDRGCVAQAQAHVERAAALGSAEAAYNLGAVSANEQRYGDAIGWYTTTSSPSD